MAIPIICLFEDEKCENFLPLTYTRPVFDLRCGFRTLREKVECAYKDAHVLQLCRAHLAALDPRFFLSDPRASAPQVFFLNARVLADRDLAQKLPPAGPDEELIMCGPDLVAARLSGPRLSVAIKWLAEQDTQSIVASFQSEIPTRQVDVTLVQFPWELIHRNGAEIRSDFEAIARTVPDQAIPHPAATVYNEADILLAPGAEVMAGAVLDARNGPIFIDEAARVEPFSFIQGPVYIGKHSRIVSGKVREDTTIGPFCRIGGEVEASIFHGYSNKYHDGFAGHSYFGEWVNLGALTTTSDLKNTYGTVRIEMQGAQVDTELTKLGSIVGDHVKLGIGVLLNSGTSIGTGCNLFGGGMMPKVVPCFIWGGDGEYQEYDFDRMLQTAQIAMSRRDVDTTPETTSMLRYVFNITAPLRRAGRI